MEEFVPETFHKLKVLHRKDSCSVEFSWKRVRLFNQRVCEVFLRMCQASPQATVLNVVSKPKSKWRPLPLDTVEMEKMASRKLRVRLVSCIICFYLIAIQNLLLPFFLIHILNPLIH